MGLGELGCHSLRARVDPGDGARADCTCRPDGASVGGEESAGHEVPEPDAVDDLVGPRIDAHDPASGVICHPDRVTACRQAHTLSATLAIRPHADRCDDSVGGGIDSRDAGPARTGDPHGPGRDGDSGRLLPDVDRRSHLVRLRIDARDVVFLRMGEPDGALTGGCGLAGRNVNACNDGVTVRVDPQERRVSVAHRPDRALAHGEGTTLRSDRDARDEPRVRRAGADPGQCARCEAARPDGVPCGGEGESRRTCRSWGDPDRRPHRLARSEVDPGHGSSCRVSGEEVPPGTRQPPGLAADVDRTPGRTKRRRVESTDLAPVTIGEPHLARRDGDAGGGAADMDATDGPGRFVDPQHLPGVGLGRPDVSVRGCESHRPSW